MITYNFIEPIEPTKITIEKTEEIERQCKSAFLLDSGSCNYLSAAPNGNLTNLDDSGLVKFFFALGYYN